MLTAVLLGAHNRMEIRLPKLFRMMSEHDAVELRQWFVTEGDIVQPGDKLIEVWAPGQRTVIPTPRKMTVPHRVIERAKDEQWPLHLGDFLIKLEPVESVPSAEERI